MVPGRMDVNVHDPTAESVSFPRSDVNTGAARTPDKSIDRLMNDQLA